MDLAATVRAIPTTTKAIRAMQRLTVRLVATAFLATDCYRHKAQDISTIYETSCELWNDCQPIRLNSLIEDSDQDAS